MKTRTLMLLAVLAIVLGGCADAVPVQVMCFDCFEYGFMGGLWHGFIAFFDFVGSLFCNDVVVYARNNNGSPYDLGFVIGSALFVVILTVLPRLRFVIVKEGMNHGK